MILADTSVWIQHLRHGDPVLTRWLEADEVALHPFIVGELSLGDLRPRQPVLDLLRRLPETPLASVAEIDRFIEQERLYASGVGYIDVHLLASARLGEARIATRDRPLRAAAARLGLLADA